MVRPLSEDSAEFLHKYLPYQSHFIEIDGHQMHYIDESHAGGDAPVVILLHGNPTWCFYYRNLIAALRPSMRVICPDFIGCGLSDHPANRHYRAADRIQHLQELVNALGLKKYSLVMHDWGGSIGTGLAVRNVAAIERLVYLNTTLTETESLPKVIKTAARPIIGKFLTKYTRHFLKLTTTLGVCKKLPKDIRNGYLYPYQSVARRTAIWDFVADIPFDSSFPSYAEMLYLANHIPQLGHVPVQIVWGLRDICFHREMLNKVAEHFPQANVLEIPDASHLVLEDSPEISNEAIKRFLVDGEGSGIQPEARANGDRARPVNALFEAFEEIAKNNPKLDAAIAPFFFGDTLSYSRANFADLKLLVNKYKRGLTKLGLARNDRVLMLVQPGIDFLALSYAVMGLGATPVFVDPGMGKDNLFQCIKDVQPHAMLGSPKAQLLRLKAKQLFPQLKFHLTVSEWIYTGGPNLSFLKKFSSRDMPAVPAPQHALIAFTSGATGTPKGVVFTNEVLASQLKILRDSFGMASGCKDLPLLPIFSLYNLALGVCSVFPPLNPAKPLELDPDKLVRIINDLGIDYSFGSPTLWNKISEYCVRTRTQLPSLRSVFMAGAPVPFSTLSLVQSLIPNGTAYTPYGATESLPTTLISSQQLSENSEVSAISGEIGTLVGKPLPGCELRVISPVDGVISQISEVQFLPALQIGEVIVKGPNVSPSYFERPAANANSKIVNGTEFWHRMGDMGYLDESGNLYFCGRKVHRVLADDRVYFSVPVERIYNQHPKVKRSALIEFNAGREAAIVIEPFPQFWPETLEAKQLFSDELQELAKQSVLTSNIKRIYFHPSFPVDVRHNAKIFRDKLAKWASRAEHYDRAA
ncbi:MAG: alpha/beta fold hydrolase [Bdellovibrionales bacterium]|nr:alpha/beta fold hydrolase [Bdellovibrionales bacterium]